MQNTYSVSIPSVLQELAMEAVKSAKGKLAALQHLGQLHGQRDRGVFTVFALIVGGGNRQI